MKIKIFYSWQTETDTRYNKNFIMLCIEKAVKKLNKKPEFKDIEFIIQEGVKGEPGSPPVAAKISDERIPSCDIFIADLSLVNQVGKLTKWFQKTFDKKEFRPSQNNNVINEYGIATNAIGVEKIIGVLNDIYGSPNENSDNIPFDLRHLRWPVNYRYSAKSNDREKIMNQLVSDLTSAIRDTSLFALEHQKSKHSPLMIWSDWERSMLTRESYIYNSKAEEINRLIEECLPDSKLTIRILGLSGLGKTRILLENFRPIINNTDSILLSSRVLYMNCSDNPQADYQAIFTRLNIENESRIVVLDNCSIEIHRKALAFAKRDNNNNFFISLDSNPEEINQTRISGVNYLVIKKEDLSSVVEEILKRDFGGIGDENIKKIREFSQGIPFMAVLLAESIKNGEKFLGKLEDKLLIDKLLGPKGQDQRNRTILRACSMFNYFGFSDELVSDVDFIAKNKNITSLNGDNTVILNEFNEVCNHYLKREIFERRGRLIGMRPFPLAMSLAQEWLEPCTQERLMDVISSIASLPEPSKSSLSEALSEQMKYLGYDDKAIEIVARITGPNSPFDNAEVLNTELGSRLFRSFVEVNPVAIAANLTRLFLNMPTEKLMNFRQGRRNLVWVLEKLCFDDRTFEQAVKILYAFAVAENETWSNNATGQFFQLFNIFLSGTEAKLEDRWKIIEWGLKKGDKEYYKLAINAMQVGLNYGNFSRSGGAEQQGTKVLQDNNPTWLEIKEYWQNILENLFQIVTAKNEFSDFAENSIARSIRSFFVTGMSELIMPYLFKISDYKEYDWDTGLNAIKIATRYEKNLISEKVLIEVHDLLEKLTKTDFITRYKNISAFHYDEDDTIDSSKKQKLAMIELANEFVNLNTSWQVTLSDLYQIQQYHSYEFGEHIYDLLKDEQESVERFFTLSLKVISQIDPNLRIVTILAGFVNESSDALRHKFYSLLFESDELNYLLFYFISISKSGADNFNLLFELIDSGKCQLSLFNNFGYSRALKQLSLEQLTDFSNTLFKYDDQGYFIAFDLMFDVGYDYDNKRKSLVPIYKKCIYKLGIKAKDIQRFGGFKLSQTIVYILESDVEVEFAQFINRSTIENISWKYSYNLDFEMQGIYEVLIKRYFENIWPELSEALLLKEEKYITFYGLKNILGSHIGGVGRNIGVLFEADIDAIFNWCREKIPHAPARLAVLAPIFNKKNNDYSSWHPITLRLLNEFGSLSEVLGNLGANMSTYSWTGSTVPLLEAKKNLFEQIKNHDIEGVRNWASSNIAYLDKEIKGERNRDAESFLY